MTDPIDTATPMASEELKPCPWCDAEMVSVVVVALPGKRDVYARCGWCMARSPQVAVGKSPPEEAAYAAWNRRAKEQSDD